MVSALGGAGADDGEAGTVRLSGTSFLWREPTGAYLHGLQRLSWAALGLPLRSLSAAITLSGPGAPLSLGEDFPWIGGLDWDTTQVEDGIYQLQATFHDGDGAWVGEAVQTVLLNNSVVWLSGRLTADQTWRAGRVHVVEGDLIIPAGVRVTVEPGAIIKFVPGVRLIVESGGVLDAQGTADLAIVFTALADDAAGGDTNLDGEATLPLPGYWRGLQVAAGGQVLVNEFTGFHYAYLNHPAGNLSVSQSWIGNYVHQVNGNITVPAGVTLTIEPGAVVKFDPLTRIEIKVGGSLVAEGLPALPIVFTSIRDDSVGGDTNGDGDGTEPQPGDWLTVFVNGGTGSFAHCDLRYGGGSTTAGWNFSGMVTSQGNAQVRIENSIVREAFYDGLLLSGGRTDVVNTLVTGADRGICAHVGGEVHVVNCTVDDNGVGLLIHGGSMETVNTLVTHSLRHGVLHDWGPDALTISRSDVWNPAASGGNYGGTADRTGLDGNLSVDPAYRDRARHDYRLGYRSPVIDAGDGASAPPTDQAGAPRYDDPRTANTGTPDGAGAYPDLGALEFVETASSDVDLGVADISGPAEVTAGQEATVTWTVRNRGQGNAVGPWHDKVSLVPAGGGPALEAGVVLAGQGAVLGPGQSLTVTGLVTIPGGTEGPYRLEITANCRGEVFEGTNAGDNAGLSTAVTTLLLPELTLDERVNGTFSLTGVPAWYKLRPPAGRDVFVSLDRSDAEGWTELFLGDGVAPTDTHYAARSTQWNRPDASVAIENADGGWYYLMLFPRSLPTGPADYQLVAQALDYTLLPPDIVRGSNRGAVTVPLRGAGFRRGMRAFLVDGTGGRREARALFHESAILQHATFDLTGLDPGLYGLEVSLDGAVRALGNIFTVDDSEPGLLRTRLVMPERARTGRVFTAWVDYENAGNTDLASPLVLVSSPTGSTLGLSPDALFTRTEATFQAVAMEGPAGILSPGARGRVPVYVLARAGANRLETRVRDEAETTPMDWAAAEAAIRPEEPPADWDLVWQGLVAVYGPAVGDCVRLLSQAATLRWLRTGERSPSLLENLAFLMRDRLLDSGMNLCGYVHLGDADHPLGGVLVMAVGQSTGLVFYAVTTEDGYLRFDDLPADTYLLYFPDWLLTDGSSTVLVPEGGAVTDLAWTVRPGGILAGAVQAPAGTIFEDTAVQAVGDSGFFGQGEVDALGNFQVRNLPAGTYTLTYGQELLSCNQLENVAVAQGETAWAGAFTCRGSGAIAGLVTDAATGLPLPGIAVAVLDAPEPWSAISQADGTYLIQGLEGGTFAVVAHGEEYRAEHREHVAVVPGRTTTGVDFPLRRGASLQGLVSDGDSAAPIPGAMVSIRRASDDSLFAAALTGEDGRYRMTNLPAGDFLVRVEEEDHFPGEQAVSLLLDAAFTLDFALLSAGSISGRVIGQADGLGIPGVELYLFPEAGNDCKMAFTDGEGRYRFGQLEPDDYVAMFADGSHRQLFLLTPQDPRPTHDFVLTVGALEGTLRESDGETPVSGAKISLLLDGHPVIGTVSSADGTYRFDLVRPSTPGRLYQLQATHDGHLFPPVADLAVEAGRPTVVPPLAAGGARLTVALVDDAGEPVTEGLRGRLVLDRPGAAEIATPWAPLGEDGRITFANLVPGRYLLENIVRALGPKRIPVTVEEGEHELTVALTAGSVFTGAVTDQTGRGLEGLTLTLYDPADGRVVDEVRTGEDGLFTVHRVPGGIFSALVADLRTEADGDRYAPAYFHDLAFGAGSLLTRNLEVMASDILVRGSIAPGEEASPLSGSVEVRDPHGFLVATATADPIGRYRLDTLGAGQWTMRASGRGFETRERPLDVAPGEVVEGFDLPLAWVGAVTPLADFFREMTGILGRADAPRPAGPLAETPHAPSGIWEWFASLPDKINSAFEGAGDTTWWADSAAFNNEFASAITRALQDLLKRPKEDPEANLPPAGWLKDCPEAQAWRKYALRLHQLSLLQFDAWTQQWDASYEEGMANLGMFGINLLKLAGDLLVLQNSAHMDGLPGFVDGQLKNIAAQQDALLQAGQLDKALSFQEEFKALLDFKSKYTAFSKGTGNLGIGLSTLGLPGGIKGVFDLPTQLGSVESFLGWANSTANFIGGLAGLANNLKAVSSRVPWLGDVANKISAITDGIATILEAWNGIETNIAYMRNLASMEDLYKKIIKRRNEAADMAWKALEHCKEDPEDEEEFPKPPWPPPPPPTPPDDDGETPASGSHDPNAKLTVGVGDEGFVTSATAIVYTIFFENMATATAAAQQVTVTDTLSGDLDWSTVELVAIGFNGVELPLPPGSPFFQGTAAVASDPNPVRVSAGLDAGTGTLTWVMESHDPVTGGLPEDPLAGFLPPNDETGRGEGHLTFSVRPRVGLSTGAVIANKATIVFDVNPPLDTNTVVNTIDDAVPESAVGTLPAVGNATLFPVSWTGSDQGSGVSFFDVWVSVDGEAYQPWVAGSTATRALFSGAFGHTYAFYAVATDRVGNKEAPPAVPDQVTTLPFLQVAPVLLAESFGRGIPSGWLPTGGWTRGTAASPCKGRKIRKPFAAPWAIADRACGGTGDDWLYTPPFDASGSEMVGVLFDQQLKGTGRGTLVGSNDGGETWGEAMSWEGPVGYPAPLATESGVWAAAQGTLGRLAFGFAGDDGYWALDNLWVLGYPATLDYWSPAAVAAPARTLLVTNRGAAPLRIVSVALAGPGKGSFVIRKNGCRGKVLAGGGSCLVEVTAALAKPGSAEAVLAIGSTDPLVPAYQVPLKATSTPVRVTPAAGTLGTSLVLQGAAFGTRPGTVKVGTQAVKVASWSPTLVRAQLNKALPPGSYAVSVLPPRPGKPATAADAFRVKPPVVLWLDAYHGKAGKKVTLEGDFYGTAKGKVTLGGKTCTVSSWQMSAVTGHGRIVFTVPRGLARGAHDLTVSNAVGVETLPGAFTID
jgi:hypothetical protein